MGRFLQSVNLNVQVNCPALSRDFHSAKASSPYPMNQPISKMTQLSPQSRSNSQDHSLEARLTPDPLKGKPKKIKGIQCQARIRSPLLLPLSPGSNLANLKNQLFKIARPSPSKKSLDPEIYY